MDTMMVYIHRSLVLTGILMCICHHVSSYDVCLSDDFVDIICRDGDIVIDEIYFGWSSFGCIREDWRCPSRVNASDIVYTNARTTCQGKEACYRVYMPLEYFLPVSCNGNRPPVISNYAKIIYHCYDEEDSAATRLPSTQPANNVTSPGTVTVPHTTNASHPDNVTSPSTVSTPFTTHAPHLDNVTSSGTVLVALPTDYTTESESRTEATSGGSKTNTLVLPIVLSLVALLVIAAVVILTVKCLQRRKLQAKSATKSQSAVSNPNYSSPDILNGATNVRDDTAVDMQMTSQPQRPTPTAPPVEPNVYETLRATPDVYAQVQPSHLREDTGTELHENPTYAPTQPGT